MKTLILIVGIFAISMGFSTSADGFANRANIK
jgi:hypothetical protein